MKRVAFAVLTLVAGAVALWAAFYIAGEVRRNRDWPTVPGKILERGVGEPMSGRGRSYLPHVTYAYAVDGKPYVNDQVYLIRRTGGTSDEMQALVDRLPDPVPVHYDPAQPSSSYLLVNSMTTFWILVVFGSLVLVVGVLQLFVVLMTKARTA
ncbi:MAG: DUF3592 domain-containing protein [Deltaproteobacteria bacterium]|nr:DUF3592 domain-containing protein [Deltaproteobacteria bacterium]